MMGVFESNARIFRQSSPEHFYAVVVAFDYQNVFSGDLHWVSLAGAEQMLAQADTAPTLAPSSYLIAYCLKKLGLCVCVVAHRQPLARLIAWWRLIFL